MGDGTEIKRMWKTKTILLMVTRHLIIEDIHNSWLYCFTNPLELGTRVSLSHRQPYMSIHTRVPSSRGLVKQYNQELCISSISKTIRENLGVDKTKHGMLR